MKIFNLVIIKQTDYESEKKKQKEKIERLEKNHVAYVGTLTDEKYSLEDRIKELKKANLDETSKLRNQISVLESKIDEASKQIDSLINSNRSYKSSNTKLSSENKDLKAENKNLKEKLALSYKFERIPADRTKSKQVPKIKSSRRESSLAKMMNR